MKTTTIYIDNNLLSFDGNELANKENYEQADRCVGSIFESLEPGEVIELRDGKFKLDDELDLITND